MVRCQPVNIEELIPHHISHCLHHFNCQQLYYNQTFRSATSDMSSSWITNNLMTLELSALATTDAALSSAWYRWWQSGSSGWIRAWSKYILSPQHQSCNVFLLPCLQNTTNNGIFEESAKVRAAFRSVNDTSRRSFLDGGGGPTQKTYIEHVYKATPTHVLMVQTSIMSSGIDHRLQQTTQAIYSIRNMLVLYMNALNLGNNGICSQWHIHKTQEMHTYVSSFQHNKVR